MFMEAMSKNMSYFTLSTITASYHSMMGLLIFYKKSALDPIESAFLLHLPVRAAAPESLRLPSPLSSHHSVMRTLEGINPSVRSLILDTEKTHKAIKCCGNVIQGPLKNVGTLSMRISPESWRFKVNHFPTILLKFYPLSGPVKPQ